MSAALQAFLRLAREHRQYRHELMHEIAEVDEKTASRQPLSLPERVRPLLKKAEGVLEDAIAYEKRRQAALKAGVPFIEEEDERFYEEHGFYPEKGDEDWEPDREEEDRSDKDEQDGQDDLTGKQEKTDEEKREEPEQEKSLNTDDTDGADCRKETGRVEHCPSGNGEQKTQEAEEQEGIIAVPP